MKFTQFKHLFLLFISWTGDKALRELEESNITRKGFRNLSNCFIEVSHFFYVIFHILLYEDSM